MTHISNYLSYVPKSASAFFGALMAFVITLNAVAAPAVQIESTMGAANVTAGDTSYSDSVAAGYDEVVKVQLWYHNMEDPTSGLVAEDLTAKFDVPTGQGALQTIEGTVGGSNTNSITSNVTVDLGRDDAYLEYIPGSAKWRHNTGTNDNVTYQTVGISDTVVTAGAGLNLEDAQPCFNFEATVTILLRVRVPSVDIEKSVAIPDSGQAWGEEVTVNPGDKVKFLFSVINNGNTQLDNVTVGDVFPNGIEYVNGSTVVTNGNHPDGVAISTDDLANGGLNLNSFAVGGYTYVTFEATVNPQECGYSTLVNKAVAKSDKAVIRTDTAVVKVNVQCEQEFNYICNALNVTILNDELRQVRAEAKVSHSSNVNVVGTEINFGDGSVESANPATHQYAADGNYDIVATVAFELDNESKDVKEATCSNLVRFTSVPGEPNLPNTGAGSALFTLFGATSATAAAYGYIQNRRTA